MSSRFMALARPLALGAAVSAGFFAGRQCPRSEGLAQAECRGPEDGARFIELMARRALRKSAPEIRHEMKAGIDGDLEIGYTFSVGEGGSLRVLDSTVSCEACRGDSELPELIGILIASEFTVPRQARSCTIEIRVEVPKLEGSEMPRIRFPPEKNGIEL